MSRLDFKLQAEASGSRARAGVFRTLHNEVKTPIFMPVGTQATVRGQRNEVLEALDFPVLLANTYHLMLRPGPEVFKKMGGIQRFMDWGASVLTDSGGFQIFSLPNERAMSEEGALFKSYVNQESILLTPERSIEMQKAIGSDIMMVLDQCIPSTAEFKDAENAMKLTHRWAKRSLAARGESPQSMFGIVQGACYEELRRTSAKLLTDLPFDGFAIGGLAVGESKNEREDMTEFTAALLPRDLPRYLMGVGTPSDLLEAVHRGVDMFDCILPTALGQQGVAFTARGKVDLRRGVYKFSEERLDSDCSCATCRRHSMSYLHHLIRVRESVGSHLVAAHNLHFYAKLMREIRESILNDTFLQYYNAKKEIFALNDRTFPVTDLKAPKRSARPMELGRYSVHESSPGVFSVRHSPSGEVMHAANIPTEESHTVYVDQANLTEKLKDQSPKELVVWDVGLGAAFNAMAAISTYENLQKNHPTPLRPMRVVSFENDLDSLRLALKHPNRFTHLRHAGPAALLADSEWKSKTAELRWTLLEGDFQKKLEEAPIPDIIFFDPFSLNTDTDAWTLEVFKKIFEKCETHSTEFFTYSSSTGVRALLLAAGFYVAAGVATGNRPETTIAFTPIVAQQTSRHSILLSNWLQHWERSQARIPNSVDPGYHQEFEARIRSHEQFFAE